jgi:hypothetical protein
MEPDHEMISRRFGDLADQAGPLQLDDDQLLRRIRRRRRVQGISAVALCAGLTAGVVGLTFLLSGHTPRQTAAAAAKTSAPKYCGAPGRLTQIPIDPRASGPPDQGVLDDAARKIDAIAGGGKDVTKGGKKPGKFFRWYGGVEISNEWRKVIVYRLPNPELDAAICNAVHEVTVQLNDIVQSAAEANRLAQQIIKETGFRKQSGFQIFTVATLMDGRVSVGVDNPGVARKALARYGPYLVIAKGAPARPN